MKTRKRILAGILTAIMTISMLPSAAFATETTGSEPETAVVSSEEYETESVTEEVADSEEAVEGTEEENSEEAVEETAEETEAEEMTGEQEEEAAEPQEEETAEQQEEEVEEPAPAEETEESVPVSTLKAYGSDYVVTVTYDASAEIPADARIKVDEITENSKKYDYNDYLEQAVEVIDSEVDALNYVRLFDIRIVDAGGNKIEPASAVDVQIRLKDVREADDTMQVVHFGEESTDVIEPEVTGNTVAFATEGFSVYAFIGTGDYEILTVNFYGADQTSLIDTVYVKNADKTNGQLDKIIHDPGAGTIPDGYAFYGWSVGVADYSVTETGSNIDQIKEYIQGLDFSTVENKTLNIYAMVVTYYKVDYIDSEENGSLSLGSDRILVKQAGEEAEYTVNMGYATDDEHDFDGWLVADNASNIVSPAPVTADTKFKNGTVITIKGNVKLSVSAPEGHWLIFDENGKYATYNAPRFVKSGEDTTDEGLLEMVRDGYSFGGWYTGAPDPDDPDKIPTGEPFVFGGKLLETTTVYAKWNKAEHAKYTVLIWKQKTVGNEYDFGKPVTVENAVVDARIDGGEGGVIVQGSGDNAYVTINGEPEQYTGFHYASMDQEVYVTPEGNAVINVYYDRTEYTLTFQSEQLYYVQVDTEYILGIPVPIMGWQRFTFRTITARYGADISSNFPIRTTAEGFGLFTEFISQWFSSLNRWEPQNGNTFDRPIVYIGTMPAENILFYTDARLTSQKQMTYYGEALDNEPVESSDVYWTKTGEEQKRFKLLTGPLGARYNYFTENEDFMDIEGYDKYDSDPHFVNGIADVNSIRFFYTRHKEKIAYMNGAYYDGNGALIELAEGEVGTSEEMAFGTDISSYNRNGDDYFTPTSAPEGFVFEGWYVDQACTSDEEFRFTTMPIGGITVYAKWRQIQYRVFLRPNAGSRETDPDLTWGSESQAMNFRVTYGDKISAPDGHRTGYRFYGWYKDEATTIPVYAHSLVMNDNTTVPYPKDSDKYYTDTMDKWGNGATYNNDTGRFWITRMFELWGKWGRVVTGAEGIGIVYDAGKIDTTDCSGEPVDYVKYQDNTSVVAGAAATPGKDGYVFKQWVVQKWNGQEFVPTDTRVLPGQTFNAHIEDAKIIDLDHENQVITLDQVVEGGNYAYTIQVVAEYEKLEETIPTHITWYKNDGSGEYYKTESGLKINDPKPVYGLDAGEADELKRDGYTFIGWAKDVEQVNAQAQINTSSSKTAPDFLEYRNGKFYLPDTDTEVTQVAADEITPYEALYACWEKNQYHIYHSATGLTTDHDIPATGKDNITAKVTDGYLYGGYYEYDATADGNRGTVITKDPGTDMVPEKDHTYYLKEVDGNYLKPNVYLVSSKIHNGMIRSLYGFVDYDVRDDYVTGGLAIGGKESSGDAVQGKDFTIFAPNELTNGNITVTQGTTELEPLTANRLFGIDTAVYGFTDLSSYISFGRKLYIQGYYVTKDGVRVTGIKTRVLQFAEKDPQYNYDVPVFTGWNSAGNTVCGLATVGSTCTAVSGGSSSDEGQSEGGTHPISPKLTLRIAADVLTYTITKVCDPGVELQTVEPGCRTGEITVPEREGYYFGGWYTDGAFTMPADFSDVRSDMTVYARYIKAEDVSVSFTLKSSKSGTVTFNATASVKGDIDLAGVTLTAKGSESVLGSRSLKKTGSGKNVKYTTSYKGTVAVKGTSLSGSFAASLAWTTADGTAVSGPVYNCKYVLGKVTVK